MQYVHLMSQSSIVMAPAQSTAVQQHTTSVEQKQLGSQHSGMLCFSCAVVMEDSNYNVSIQTVITLCFA